MSSDALSTTFAALADPTRRSILRRLAEVREATVSELAAPFDLTQPTISRHLKVLEQAGLITRRRDAQRRPCRLAPKGLEAAATWLERYRRSWEGSFAQVDEYLARRYDETPARPYPEGKEE